LPPVTIGIWKADLCPVKIENNAKNKDDVTEPAPIEADRY